MIKTQSRIFGFLISSILSVFFYFNYEEINHFKKYLFITALLYFTITSIVIPQINTPLVKAWIFIGEKIRKAISTIFLFFFYFLIITPLGQFLKLTGRLNFQQSSFKNIKGNMPNIKFPF